MKILFPYMARWFAENWTRYHSLLEELGKMGYEVHVMQPPPLSSSKETNYREIAGRKMDNLFIHDIELNQKIWSSTFPFDKLFKKAYYTLLSRKYALELIKQHKIDYVLIYNIPHYFYASLDGVKVTFDFADDYVDMLGYEIGKFNVKPVRFIANYLLKNMMQKSDLVISVSHELAKVAFGNVHVLPNGVNQSNLIDTSLVNSSHSDQFTVGFLGSFEYFIDFDIILDAAIQLPAIKFLLVGYGRDFNYVETRVISENIQNVTLTGGVPHDEVFKYIDSMDVCLNIFKRIPVAHKACPIKLFEYLARLKPVISSRLKELEYIDTRDYLYYADEVDELIETINIVKSDYPAAMLKAKIGYTEVKENYTWQKVARKFVTFLR